MKLNVGCGNDLRPGYLNIDKKRFEGVDVLGDVSRLPLSDGSVEEIYASDVIEHFPWRTVKEVVLEWRRVLKRGGRLFIRTPNLEGLIELYQNRRQGWAREEGREKGIDPIVERLYGGQDFEGNFHYVIFDRYALEEFLRDIGFAVIEIVPDGEDISNLTVVARKTPHGEEKLEEESQCPKRDSCPILDAYIKRIDAEPLFGDPSIEVCTDDLRFYGPKDLMNEDKVSFCPSLQKLKKRISDARVSWEAPIFGPSGYAFAARGSVLGLADIEAAVQVQPVWGDCEMGSEAEVETDV